MVLDNFRTIELIWDKANKSIIKTIKTASSDTTGRYLSVKILDGGQEVTLNGASLQLYWEHPNFNTRGTDNFSIVNNGGLFRMTFSKEMLTNVGELNAHLVLTLSDGKITSDKFTIKVIKGADDGVVIPSNGESAYITVLENALEKIRLIEDGAEALILEDNSITTTMLKDNAVTFPKMSTPISYHADVFGFSKANFDINNLGVDEDGNLTLIKAISSNTFHKWFVYADTDYREDILESTATFNTDGPNSTNRIFFEDSNGVIVWFNLAKNTNKVEGYVYDNYADTLKLITAESGSVNYQYPTSENYTMKVRFNGDLAVVYINNVEICAYDFSNYITGTIKNTGIAFRGDLNNNSKIKDFKFAYKEKPYFHFSVDDFFSALKDLTDNESDYVSIFDQPDFKILKTMYDTYNAKFSLYVFNTMTTDTSFALSDVTDKFKQEFADNAHWLKFGFHARDEVTRNTELTDSQLVSDVTQVHTQIARFATTRNIDKVPRFSFFNINKSALIALRNQNLILGALGADDNRAENAGLSGVGLYAIRNSDSFKDEANEIKYFKTETRMDGVSDARAVEILEAIYKDPNHSKDYIVFSHHISERILTKCFEWAKVKGIATDYPQNHLY